MNAQPLEEPAAAQRQAQQPAQFPLEQWYYEIPPVTRLYATLIVATTLLCQLQIISPFHLYFNYKQIVHGKQYWRLVSNFLYFGSFGVDFLFYLFFLTRYCRMLEEGSFRGRTADFMWMLLLGAIGMTIVGPVVHLMFLGSSLTFMMVYIWSRRNPDVRLNFLGVLNFNAPMLPWVLMIFSMLLNNSFPMNDALGIVFGHIYYFLDDIYPITSGTGRRYLRAPLFVKQLIEPRNYNDASIQGVDQEGVVPHDDDPHPHRD